MKIYFFLVFGLMLCFSCTTDENPAAIEDQLNPKGDQGKPGTAVTRYLSGDPADVSAQTQAGLMLMGGGLEVDEAMHWQIARSGGGDFVVIRASGSDGYNPYIYSDLGGVNSVETIIVNSSDAANQEAVATTVRNAEALFIAGGDQHDYETYWKGSLLEDAIHYLINEKQITIGGTSAGLAILGEYYYGAAKGSATSDALLSNPYHRDAEGLGTDFLAVPFLENTITDSHYSERDRYGRHMAFMARLITDWSVLPTNMHGIGVDEETAACVDENGLATVYGLGDVYFIKSGNKGPELCQKREPLHWYRNQQAVQACRVPGTANGQNSFSLADWQSQQGGYWYYWYANEGTFRQQPF